MYRDTSRRHRRNLIVATLIVLFILAVDLLTHGAVRSPVRAVSLTLWSGIHRSINSISASGFFSSRAHLAAENQGLKQQISAMQDEIAAARRLASRTRDLEAAAHLVTQVPGVTAPIISSSKTSPYGTFSIGAGSSEGVRTGALVRSIDGFAIGRVVEAAAHQSLVKELFAARETIEGLLADTPITLTGKGGGNAEGKLPRGTKVDVGTYIYGRIDRAHVIGIVGHVEGGETSPSLTIYARTPVNLETIQLVYVDK